MNATLTETKEQEKRRLLTDLHASEASYAVARRLERWTAAQSYAADVARLCRVLELCEREQE